MTPPTTPLEVIETSLAFHGGPEPHRQQRRMLHVDDIQRIDAHAARSQHGWHPVCTLTLFGGEQITIAGDATPHHADAHQHAAELAATYRFYLPAPRDDELDAHPPPGDTGSPHLFYDCAVCASLDIKATGSGGTAS
jgi:hypothetical protein